MKKIILSLCFILLFAKADAQTQQQIDNQITFTKLYGYVRYFHPSDEAAGIDWDKFAIYGAGEVNKCTDRQALKKTLTALFNPIAPTLQIIDDTENVVFAQQQLIPPSLSGYKTIAWQHVGIGTMKYKESQFQSARTNRSVLYQKYVQTALTGESMSNGIDATPYQNKQFVLKGRAKLLAGPGFGHFWASVDKMDKTVGFFDNSFNNLIKQSAWMDFEINGTIDRDAERLRFGVLLEGAGDLWVDNVSLSIKDGDVWKELYNNNFNTQTAGITVTDPLNPAKKTTSEIYTYGVIADANSSAEKWAEIKSTAKHPQKPADIFSKRHTSLFKTVPKVGEHIDKNIGSGLKIVMPISLYGDNSTTYPVADQAKLTSLKNSLDLIGTSIITADSLSTRLADIAITWNVFQHFFPYLDVVKTDWQQDLKDALISANLDKSADDFHKTLKKFTAKLQDGHINISWPKAKDYFYLPVGWDWAEDKLVITRVLDSSTGLKRGDVITAINDKDPKAYFAAVEQYISAATPGSLMQKALTQSLLGIQNSTLQVTYLGADNREGKAVLKRILTAYTYYKDMPAADTIKRINNDITYINIGLASMKAIDKILPQLQKNKAIICDLRNFTTDNWTTNHFIEYLLTKKDTATHWMQTPQRIYPDQQQTVGNITEGFELVPAKPHLNAKIIFIVDASEFSWAESYIGIIDHYKLATFIGQSTGGTNGDINSLTLPGEYTVSFTGLKVTQLDGSQHHGIGTKPDIYVNKTIKGLRENRDEFLEKAIEVAEGISK
nr:S41 family peptidase [uncultured Mucilaginibacter sp.]